MNPPDKNQPDKNHPDDELVRAYAAGLDLPADRLWAVEGHLEKCAGCRARLAAAVPPTPLLEAVWARLEPELTRPAGGRAARRWSTAWLTPVMVPWLVMAVLLVAGAVVLDRLLGTTGLDVTGVQLVAPVLPVLGVAAAWSRGLDPAYEVVVSTPRAGLYLVLRRTATVLAVLVPLLGAAGWLTGTALVLWLLPCLALTTATLALGSVVGVRSAAVGLSAAWALLVVAPSGLDAAAAAVVTGGAATPVWAGVLAVAALFLVLRRGAFEHLGAHR